MPDSNTLKLGIVWANPYNKNLGVGALAYSALALLNDVVEENGMHAQFTFIGSNKYGQDSVQIGGNTITFDNLPAQNYMSWKTWIKFMILPLKYRVPKLLSLNYLFDVGEGDSFADIYGQFRFDRIYGSKVFFSKFRKKQVLLPQTIGPFSDSENKKKADDIMKKMEFVFSRDTLSYNYTKGVLSKEKINELIDLAFYLPFKKASYSDSHTHVGINVSGLLWNGGYTGKNQFSLKLNYQETIKELIEYFLSLENTKVHIISHVVPEDNPVEDDFAVATELQKIYPDVIVPARFNDCIEAKSYISGMDYFTGARMHSCIAAFSSGVPVVPMAYSRKFNGLFVETLQYNEMADCVNEIQEIVVDKVKKGFENRGNLKTTVEHSLSNIVKPRLDLLKNQLLNIIK